MPQNRVSDTIPHVELNTAHGLVGLLWKENNHIGISTRFFFKGVTLVGTSRYQRWFRPMTAIGSDRRSPSIP